VAKQSLQAVNLKWMQLAVTRGSSDLTSSDLTSSGLMSSGRTSPELKFSKLAMDAEMQTG
jgi:hypothetical protein